MDFLVVALRWINIDKVGKVGVFKKITEESNKVALLKRPIEDD